MRFVVITVTAAMLAACASGTTATCYKTQRATAGRDGRALVAYACPSDQQAAHLRQPSAPGGATPG